MCACIHAYARVRARENFLIKKRERKEEILIAQSPEHLKNFHHLAISFFVA